MITRLYANNFRCLVAFEAEFDSFGVLCGPNGSGKSSVFDALRFIRNLASGDLNLGSTAEGEAPDLELTNWLDSPMQEFELQMTSEGHTFEYVLHIEQVASDKQTRIVKERATCDGRTMFERDLDGVWFLKPDGAKSGFPLDWRQSALASIQPAGDRHDIETLQHAIARLLILRPNPHSFLPASHGESPHPGLQMRRLIAWYRFLAQEQDWTDSLRDSLRDVWPDFKSFRLENVGPNAKTLQLRFGGSNSSEGGGLILDELSDGEKALVGMYMVRAALATGAVQTVLIDEPDNFVGLPELQPWVLSIRELLDEKHQAILISHHPEILSSAGEDFGHYLWRDNHASPTRIGPLKVPEGLSPGEALARGWVRG